MMALSARLSLPLLAAGQAQKEITHNEALQKLEMLVQPVLAAAGANAPPSSPQIGCLYLCGVSPAGDWAGHANALALWTPSGWRFVAAFEGMEVTSFPTGQKWVFRSGAWVSGVLICNELKVGDDKVVGARAGPIPNPQGGDTVDTQVRATVDAILGALRSHGLISS